MIHCWRSVTTVRQTLEIRNDRPADLSTAGTLCAIRIGSVSGADQPDAGIGRLDGHPRLSAARRAAQARAFDLRAEVADALPGGSVRWIRGLR